MVTIPILLIVAACVVYNVVFNKKTNKQAPVDVTQVAKIALSMIAALMLTIIVICYS